MAEFDFNKIKISDEPIAGSSLAVMEYLGEKYDVKFREDPTGQIIISEGRLDTFQDNLINLVSENFSLIRSLNAVFKIKTLMYSNAFNRNPVKPDCSFITIDRDLLKNDAEDIKDIVRFAIFLHEKCHCTPVILSYESGGVLMHSRNDEYFPWYATAVKYTADILQEFGYSLDTEHISIRSRYEYSENTVSYNIEHIRKYIPNFLPEVVI